MFSKIFAQSDFHVQHKASGSSLPMIACLNIRLLGLQRTKWSLPLIHLFGCLPLIHLRGNGAVLATGEDTVQSQSLSCNVRWNPGTQTAPYKQVGTQQHFR